MADAALVESSDPVHGPRDARRHPWPLRRSGHDHLGHAFGGSLTLGMWDTLAPLLALRSRLIAYDTRGHGDSDNPQGRFSYHLLANDAAEISATLNFDHPVVIGYSDGGTAALRLVVEHPDLARAVIVAGATP